MVISCQAALSKDPNAPNPPPTTEPPAKFPDANILVQSYDLTTSNHMPDLQYWMKNADQAADPEPADVFALTDGPFGFGFAVKVDDQLEQCLKRSPYASEGDCSSDPRNCTRGLSMSVWERVYIPFDVFHTSHKVELDPKKYIISTGGDELGHPGVGLYHQGITLVGLVSTGDYYWKVIVFGPVPSKKWTNIGLRWSERDGIELYVNGLIVGADHRNHSAPSRKDPLNPDEILIGCHRDSSNPTYRGYNGADFDEFAQWDRRLPDNQVVFFLGGYEGEMENLGPKEFGKMLEKTDLKDPKQAAIAMGALNAMADFIPEMLEDDNDTVTEDSGASGNETVLDEGALKLIGIADVIHDLTKTHLIKDDLTLEEMETYMDIIEIASKILDEQHAERWEDIAASGHRGAIGVKDDIQGYIEQIAMNIKMAKINPEPKNFTKITDNIIVKIDKMTVSDFHKKDCYFKSPNFRESEEMRKAHQDWGMPSDKALVPTWCVIPDPRCKDYPISVVVVYFDSFDDVGPKDVNLDVLNGDVENVLDSRILQVNVVIDPPEIHAHDYYVCRVDWETLKETGVQTTTENKDQQESHRSRDIKFHHNELISPINQRHCVWWNPTLGKRGAWDPSGCNMLYTSAHFTKCSCKRFGTFGVIAEHVEEKVLPEEPTWSKAIKFIGYIVSFVCLLIYILVVLLSGDLKDHFHLSGVFLSASIIGGSLSLLLSDNVGIRNGRHSCAAIGTMIHGFYLLTGLWVAMIGHAGFKAVTKGIIGGRLRSYVMISFGITFISIGTSYAFFIHDLGTDPRCFISWFDDLKFLLLFLPLLVCMGVSIFFACVIFFNVRHASNSNKIIKSDYSSFTVGSTLITFYFAVVWIMGMLAYLKIDEMDSGVFPYFQILNSFMGVAVLLGIGFYSSKFRGVFMSGAKKKRAMLEKYKEDMKHKKAAMGNKSKKGKSKQGKGTAPEPQHNTLLAT